VVNCLGADIVYYIPDLDGTIVAWFNDSLTNKPLACVQCSLSNGKTVYQQGVSWSIGVITLICLLSSAVLWCRGYAAASVHLAARTVSLIVYYQAVAAIGKIFPPLIT
jgi:hypothetical protein